MIQFQISAPASLSLFGEQTDNIIRASVDLRTTLNFQELYSSNNIEINFSEMNLFHKMPLRKFLKLYDRCIKNMDLLHLYVLLFTCSYTLHEQRFLPMFYYLLVYIMYEEQIARSEIKEFRIDLSTKLLMDKNFFCLAPLKVCLAACLLHWTRLQKNIHNTFDDTDLNKIYTHATHCEYLNVSELDKIDIAVCTYGLMMQCEIKKRDTSKVLFLSKMIILLVDSKQTPDAEALKQRVREVISLFPHIGNPVMENIDDITNTAAATFQELFDISNENELSAEIKTERYLKQYKILEYCTRVNQSLLRMLDIPYYHLDKICAIAEKYGLSAKYTDLGNGRYAYVWCSLNRDIELSSYINELNAHGFDVITTDLFCTGVKID